MDEPRMARSWGVFFDRQGRGGGGTRGLRRRLRHGGGRRRLGRGDFEGRRGRGHSLGTQRVEYPTQRGGIGLVTHAGVVAGAGVADANEPHLGIDPAEGR
jgi:hypothetical protein